jgi:ribosomal 50S subunit-associated protein YjgA (DUF615 family)
MQLISLLLRIKSAVARPCFLKHTKEDKELSISQHRREVTEVLALGENPFVILRTRNLKRTGLGLNPSLKGERPKTNRYFKHFLFI